MQVGVDRTDCESVHESKYAPEDKHPGVVLHCSRSQAHGVFELLSNLPGVLLQYVDKQESRETEDTACPSLHGQRVVRQVQRAKCVIHQLFTCTAPHAGKQRRTKVIRSSMLPVNAEQLMEVTDVRFFFCRTSNVNSSCMSPMTSTDFAPPLSSSVLCVCRI